MFAIIGLMMASYIITRMVELLIGSEKKTTKILSIVTLVVNVLGMLVLLRLAGIELRLG